MEHIVIIGGGVGGALAHDLILRGFRVTLLEKGQVLCGATGRHHGLLHSGARYVLHDVATARECYEENQILRRIAPQAIEPNDGLFVALDDGDQSYQRRFIDRCAAAGIPTRVLDAAETLALEPALNPALKSAVRVPDGAMDAWRLALAFFATARANGARIRDFTEVVDLRVHAHGVTGVKIIDHRTQLTSSLSADLVVNAAGAWAAKIAALAGLHIPLRPGPGVMVSLPQRLTNMVVNRLHPAGVGDIIVPQRNLSIIGTTAWLAEDPDQVNTPADHIDQLMDLAAMLVPQVKTLSPQAAWSASRPLLSDSADSQDAMRISRGFDCVDHKRRDNLEGLISLIGGKATTMRAMAEQTADLVCKKTGRRIHCRTKQAPLQSYRCFFTKN